MTADGVLRYGVFEPRHDEAPSGWISRLALTQGCSLREMLDFLDLAGIGDFELTLRGPVLAELRRRCSLPPSAFALSERVMARVSKAGIAGDVLLKDDRGKPRFRFCPVCLGQKGASIMPVTWRFADWRYCPTHHCLMEDRCASCGGRVRYPCDMAAAKAGRDGYASQRRCMRCAADLAAAGPCALSPCQSDALNMREARWISDGCALVKALFLPNNEWASISLGSQLDAYPLPSVRQWKNLVRRLKAISNGAPPADVHTPKVRYDEMRPNWGHRILERWCDGNAQTS